MALSVFRAVCVAVGGVLLLACSDGGTSPPAVDARPADARADVVSLPEVGDTRGSEDRPADEAPDAADTGVAADTASDVASVDTGAPECTCNSGCGAQERCLQNQFGGVTPGGVSCAPVVGLAQCRPTCDQASCPAGRPHCRPIMLSAGCCSDAVIAGRLCCANAEATNVGNCM